MSRRSSATSNVNVGISRAIGTDIEKVQVVAANIQAVITASETDLAGLAASLEQAVDFTGITVQTSAVGSAATWDASTKVLTVPTVEGAKGDSGDALEVVSITPVAGGTFEWLFSDGTLYTTPSLRGHTGDKGDTGDAGVSVGVSTIVYQGTGSFLWTFTDGTSYLTPDIRGSQGEQGIEGLKGDVGSPLELDSVIPQGGGVMLWKFNDGSDYLTPSLLGPEGEQGDTGSKGDQGVSIHHLKGTATTDPEGDFGSFGEADTFTFYGDSAETIVLGYFSIRNGFDAEADRLAATASADLAEKWATEATDVVIEDGKYSSSHHADKSLGFAQASSDSADVAVAKADVATTKASEAATSANNASTSENNSATSASESATSASESLASENAADGHKTVATTKANEASQSASEASTSETNASDSATVASTKADTATSKATEAANSATTASTQADNSETSKNESTAQANIATTKASDASTSADEAAASATAAESAETSAETAENAAELAESHSEAAQAAAEDSQAAASASQSSATASADSASSSANNAQSSEDDASTSESNAAASASASASSASASSTSANSSSNSATTATNKANIATTKANEASTSASNAADSEATTNTNVGLTNDDVVLTGADVDQTTLDRAATADDVVQTGSDKQATNDDVTSTSSNASTATTKASEASSSAADALTYRDDTQVLVDETEVLAESVLFNNRATGVSSTYVSTVAVGGTTFSQPEITGTITSDQGYFVIAYAGATDVSLDSLSSSSVYVYLDTAGNLQQQTTIPTRQDWSRKIFTMRISVDTAASEILGFEYLNNPLGDYANSIRDLYTYLIANGVPFKKDQVITGRDSDLGFDVSSGSLMEFGGTGDTNNANIKNFNPVSNASYTLLSRTGVVSEETNLVKYWDNNGVITALGSTTLVGHRLYRFSNGNFAIQYGQGNYANLALAKAGVLSEEYEVNTRVRNATFFGWWFIESTATNTGGTTLTHFKEYTIGIQGGSSSGFAGCLLKGNNLSDLQSLEDALINMGLESAFTDDYHPNADKLTTGRTISLSGDVSGSVLFDGSSDVSIDVEVANVDSVAIENLLKEATLNLDFVNNNYEVYEGPVDGLTGMPFNDALDFSRSSAATAHNATGGLDGVLADDQRLVGNREGLLMEEQRTNLIRYSEDFSDAAWAKTGSTLDSNIQIAPDGNLTADGLTLTAGDSGGVYVIRTVSGSKDYTGSVYAKDSTALHSEITFAFYDHTNSTFIEVQAFPEIEELSNGWFRLSSTVTTPSDCVSLRFYPVRGDFSGGDQVLIWGAQLEKGSFPTSYIPTAGAQVTRVADNCSRVLSNEFNKSRYTVYATFNYLGIGVIDTGGIFELGKGSSPGSGIDIRISPTGVVGMYTPGTLGFTLGNATQGVTHKVAFSYDNGSIAAVLDSASIQNAVCTEVESHNLELMLHDSNEDRMLSGTLLDFKIIPRVLSAAELQMLTSQEA